MGLSEEERLSRFFWSMLEWRKRISCLQESLNTKEVRSRKIVSKWVRCIDEMTGSAVREINQSSAYWIMGENETSFRGLMSNPDNIRHDAEPDIYISLEEAKYKTVEWWNNATFSLIASHLTNYPHNEHEHEGLDQLAKWWDAFNYVSAVIYPVWRYEDAFFKKNLKTRFHRLIGEMVNLRFEVCFPQYGNKDEQNRIETYLLLKTKAFHLLLADATKKFSNKAYLEKEFDGYALFKKLANMNALDMKNLFEEEARKKQKIERKYCKQNGKEGAKKNSGLFGPPIISASSVSPSSSALSAASATPTANEKYRNKRSRERKG